MPRKNDARVASRRDHPASANERLKSRWGSWVVRSTALAVVLHVAAFSLAAWHVHIPVPDSTTFRGRALALLPPTADETASDPLPAPARPIPVRSEPTEGAPPEATGFDAPGPDSDVEALWDRLARRLGDPRALVPTLADPESEPESEAESEPDERPAPREEELPEREVDVGRSGGRLSELETLPEADSLDLSRLTELSPELALVAPSVWVLIRNPLEVEEYLRGGYSRGQIDPAARGSVSVTLWIDERGSVEWAEISESSGHADLDEFALALFNEVVVFRPAREEGVRVSRSVSFAVNFPW